MRMKTLAAAVAGAGDPPLAAVDDVPFAVPLDPGADVRGVRGRHVRLGHRVSRADRAVEERRQPAALLFCRAVAHQHFHVPRVGRRAVEYLRRNRRAPHDFAERGVFQVRQAAALLAFGQEQVPEAGRPRPTLHLVHDRRCRPPILLGRVLLRVGRLVRIDDLIHEGEQPLPQPLDARAEIEVHGVIRPRSDREWSADLRAGRRAAQQARTGRAAGASSIRHHRSGSDARRARRRARGRRSSETPRRAAWICAWTCTSH